jgi:anti-sigma regulatory factor (Ser/Thr protein kinase)
VQVQGPAARRQGRDGDISANPPHAAALYGSEEDLPRRVLPFLYDGLTGGETTVVIASPTAAEALQAGLGADARDVQWLLPDVSYRSLGPMFSGLRSYLADQHQAGNRVRLVAENPTVSDPARTRAYLRFEAASNDVLGAYGFPWACLYDRRRYPRDILEQVTQVHPHLLDPGGRPTGNADYLSPDTYLKTHPGPLSSVPPQVALDVRLTAAAQLPTARYTATGTAVTLGLPAAEAEDFELATGEVLSNAVRHGEHPCRLRLWASPTHVVLRVDDRGLGDDIPVKGFRPPDPARSHLGGMGMWIIRLLADVVHVRTGPTGTAVEVQFPRTDQTSSGVAGAG